MGFISVAFLAFLLVFMAVYSLTPGRYRYLTLAVGSYLFYGYRNPKALALLLATTLITYIGGVMIAKKRSKRVFLFFFCVNISILLFFKYTDFALVNFNYFLDFVGEGTAGPVAIPNLILPAGLSFYIFQSCTYLGDVYKEKILPEKNPMLYAAFVSFFPTILMGPIQKARELIPQIKNPAAFDFDRAVQGTILIIWGFFEKLLVANNLLAIVNKVWGGERQGAFDKSAYYILAAISFSVYIYADFSSYSDIARGIAKLLGIEIGRNFRNPYLSQSLS